MKDQAEKHQIEKTGEQIVKLGLRKQIADLEELNIEKTGQLIKLEEEKAKLKENLDLFKSDIQKSTKLRLETEQKLTANNSEISMLKESLQTILKQRE